MRLIFQKPQTYYAILSLKILQIFEQPVQAIHWCATARCGGTRGGTTTAGRWFVAQLDHHPENRASWQIQVLLELSGRPQAFGLR